MPRYRQLHVMLSEDEMAALKALAGTLGTTTSDTVRILIQAGSASPSAVEGATLMFDRQTLALHQERPCARPSPQPVDARPQRNHQGNAETGVDALDLAEAMRGVSYRLDEVRRDTADVRQQATTLIGMPVVFGE